MRVSFRQPAGQAVRYAHDAFTSQTGNRVPLLIGDVTADCELVGATVSDDGSEVVLTFEVPEESAAAAGLIAPVPAGAAVTFRSAEVTRDGYRTIAEWVE